MSKTDAFEDDLLEFIFQDTAIPWEAGATDLHISLHTSDPGEAGTQTTNEATYTSYGRIAVVRSAGGWLVTGTAPTTADNVAAITFVKCTGGSNTITHFGVGTDLTGVGNLLYKGALTSSLVVSNNVTPEFAIGDLNVTED